MRTDVLALAAACLLPLLAAPAEGPVLAALVRAHQVSWPRP